mgnify:CR=1
MNFFLKSRLLSIGFFGLFNQFFKSPFEFFYIPVRLDRKAIEIFNGSSTKIMGSASDNEKEALQ